MEIERQRIRTDALQKGMYVCDLDRPWLETPFLMQGILLESVEDIQELAHFCDYVYVDVAKSRPSAVSKLKASVSTAKKQSQPPNKKLLKAERLNVLLDGREIRPYHDSVSWNVEVGAAKKAIAGITGALENMFADITAGKGLQIAKLKQAVSPLVGSIERNPDACIWLARVKNSDSYAYKHSIATSIWVVSFGRELGLPPHDLKSLALGALLLDVGKLEVPRELLDKKGRVSPAEFIEIQKHVKHSLEALNKSASSNTDVWVMVAYHHERCDGSGYPAKLNGNDIPLFAQLAGIADSYDAMINERPYQKAMSPSLAIKHLYKMRGTEFDPVLVEEFIQAVGLYPAGTLVLLTNEEVGVVIAEGRIRRLKPQVLVLLDSEKNGLDEIRVLNLLDATENGKPIEIVKSLEPASYEIDLTSIDFDPQEFFNDPM